MPVIACRGGRALALASVVAFAATGVVVGAASAGDAVSAAPLVIKPKVLDSARAAELIHALFPDLRVRNDARTGSVVVFGPQKRLDALRSTFDSLDSKGPSTTSAQAFALHAADPARLAATLHTLYPGARIVAGPQRSLIVAASSQQLAEIASIVQAVDAPPPAPSSAPRATESVTLGAARPADVARIVDGMVPGVRSRASGQNVVFAGPPDAVEHAKQLAAQLDLPAPSVRYTQVYRLRFIDAASLAALLTRTLPGIKVDVDAQLNAVSAQATTSEHQRIADALAQLDVAAAAGSRAAPNGPPLSQPGQNAVPIVASNGQNVEVVTLRAATPGLANAPSTSASDIATAVAQSLQPVAPDLHVSVMPNNPSQLILAGSPDSIHLAKQLIAQLDVAQKLVVLDTEILEVDANYSKDLGLSLGSLSPAIATTYTEQTPAPVPGGVTPPLQGLQALARTPLTFSARLNLLVSRGNARVLADPRITTVSGRTATIRAGENISILVQSPSTTGVAPTSQIQTFQTGVTLDITPVINDGNFITVALHPVVNSLSGTNSGVPQISTRDTQTTVAIQADQTLVIGGLIQDNSTRNEQRIPFLGDLPIVGKIFRETSTTGQRNELVITVTPHVLNPGDTSTIAPRATIGLPTPIPLPTIPPTTELPPARPGGLARIFRPHAGRDTPTPLPAATVVVPLGPTPVPTPTPAPVPVPTPRPTPSAFAQANTFTFGAAPQNNFAGPGDPVRVYFATFGPTVLKNETPVTISAITSSNAAKVTIGYQGGATQQLVPAGAPGQWQASYTFKATGLPPTPGTVPLTLTATRLDGTSSSITIPVSVTP